MPTPPETATRDRANFDRALGLLDAAVGDPASPSTSRRGDGWTAERQHAFLAAVAEGRTVEAAARGVGLSASSAYAFRQRAAGAVFSMGWTAAQLLQRQRMVDMLTSRAIDGQVDTITRADGTEVTRHRHDNRLGLSLLARLDRLAERVDTADPHGEAHAVRAIAAEWGRWLDLVAAGASPAQAGLFLAARAPAPADGVDPAAAALAPIVSLARADLYLRTGAGTAAEVDIAGLDPAARADWTADQWRRAEAAGLVALAPAAVEETSPTSQHPQHSPAAEAEDDGEDGDEDGDDRVWWDEDLEEWRTDFPPPPGHHCDEEGDVEDGSYHRALTAAEIAVVEPARRAARDRQQAEAQAERRAWFRRRAPEPDLVYLTEVDWLDDDAEEEPALH